MLTRSSIPQTDLPPSPQSEAAARSTLPLREIPHSTEERQLAERSSNRYFELDALRGIAAFCVLWHHLRSALPGDPLHHKLLYPLFAGHQSVKLFFVLSGFVLSLPYLRGRQLPYGRYLARRIARIYLPYLGALALAWVCARHFLFARLPLTPWFYLTWQTPLTWQLLLKQLAMNIRPDLNTAFWSLHYEMEMSILFPLFMLSSRRLPLRWAALATAVAFLLGSVGPVDFRYMAMFWLGILISQYSNRLLPFHQSLTSSKRAGLLLGAFLLYYLQIPERFRWHEALDDGSAALGGAGIILFALYSPRLKTILRHQVFEYLGKVSYSLYLVHGTVLFVLLNLIYGKVPVLGLCGIFIALSLIVAHLFYYLVEAPSIHISKRLNTRTVAPGATLATAAQ